MNLTPWKRREEVSRPAPLYPSFSRDFDGLFNAFFGSGRPGFAEEGMAAPLDVTETKDGVVVKADLPGLDKKDIEVTVKDGVLSISGERREEREEDRGELWHSERSWGSFYRSLRLPEGTRQDGVKAEYKDGVLTVRLAKDEARQPKSIHIN